MWAAALAFVQPAAALLKPYWKYLVGAIVLIALIAFTHNWYEGKLDAAYERGVAVTEAKDAVALAEREKLNAEIASALSISAAAKQAELEGKLHANEITANDLRTRLRTQRVCSDERSGRPLPGSSPSAGIGDGTSANDRPVESAYADSRPTVGDDLVTIAQACQVNTDKLITLQSYVRDVIDTMKRAKGSRHAR